MKFTDNNKELAPCIVSKVKHALGLKAIRPNNVKPCSQGYWEKTVKTVGQFYNCTNSAILTAIQAYDQYV